MHTLKARESRQQVCWGLVKKKTLRLDKLEIVSHSKIAVDDYGLNYYAAFVGCSAESEANFRDVSHINKLNQLKIKHVVTIENSDQKIAKSVIKNADGTKKKRYQRLSIRYSRRRRVISKNKTYLKTMESNLKRFCRRFLTIGITKIKLNKMVRETKDSYLVSFAKACCRVFRQEPLCGEFDLEINNGDYICIIGKKMVPENRPWLRP